MEDELFSIRQTILVNEDGSSGIFMHTGDTIKALSNFAQAVVLEIIAKGGDEDAVAFYKETIYPYILQIGALNNEFAEGTGNPDLKVDLETIASEVS